MTNDLEDIEIELIDARYHIQNLLDHVRKAQKGRSGYTLKRSYVLDELDKAGVALHIVKQNV